LREQLLLYRQRLLERLHLVGEDIVQAVAKFAPERWHSVAIGGESPHRILANLRVVEAQAFSVRLQRILDEEQPFLPLFDNKKWMDEHYDSSEPPENILEDYIVLRRKGLARLNRLSIQDWNRTGRHPWWGVRALQWWVEQTVRFSEEQLQRLRAASSE
jgi:hypothetical protein